AQSCRISFRSPTWPTIGGHMKIESRVTSVSWIPLEAIQGMPKYPFQRGVAHYDLPPPDVLDDLEGLRQADAFRFANELRAWIDVEDGRITGCGQTGSGHIGSTRLQLGPKAKIFPGISLPELRPEPEVGDASVRFVQTAGGRTGVAAPRTVSRPPYVQIAAPTAWTTLGLTISADGSSSFEVVGASSFPRHWIYDHDGKLSAKVGLIDFKNWYRDAFGQGTPWGGQDSEAVVTQIESALEHELSKVIIDSKPQFRRIAADQTLVEQGDQGDDVFLLFDGVMRVERDGEAITELGPGGLLGELAGLTDGRRTATLRAVTPCRVAVVPKERLDKQALEAVAETRKVR
ncbi:MAG: cyclic nucleotide-binding domain-containing protein, partial [Actinomycetota bacterium]|nr:cyclic nucleotide-binding domain-containing protein [Actinomycetota bacterium]